MRFVLARASVATTLPSSPPVTMRFAVARRGQNAAAVNHDATFAAFGAANSSASSPSTNTGVLPRKCTPTTGAGLDRLRALGDGG